jgi:hypothetical protein
MSVREDLGRDEAVPYDSRTVQDSHFSVDVVISWQSATAVGHTGGVLVERAAPVGADTP